MTRGLAALLALAAPLSFARLAGGAGPTPGEHAFRRCLACHSVVAGEHDLPGPNLRGVLGRRAGTLPGFAISPAMVTAGAARGLVWTSTTLEAFLADSQRVVPVRRWPWRGCRMPRRGGR